MAPLAVKRTSCAVNGLPLSRPPADRVATLALLLSVGLWYRSVCILLRAAVSVSPGWVFFVRMYEQRELDIRFGSAYREYRGRTPFL